MTNEQKYYVLRRNKRMIYYGDDFNKVDRLLPRHVSEHNGDVYTLTTARLKGDEIEIIFRANTGRHHLGGQIDAGEKVTIEHKTGTTWINKICLELFLREGKEKQKTI